MIKPCVSFSPLLTIPFLLTALSTQAAEPQQPSKQETSDEELVKQTQNPIADLISVPFQNNYNFAAGPKHNHMIYLLNIEPVISDSYHRGLEPDLTDHPARHQHPVAGSRRQLHGTWGHEPDVLFVAGELACKAQKSLKSMWTERQGGA